MIPDGPKRKLKIRWNKYYDADYDLEGLDINSMELKIFEDLEIRVEKKSPTAFHLTIVQEVMMDEVTKNK